jgi:AraC-like DNA-binding protein
VLPARLLLKDGTDGSTFLLPAHCELVVARLDRRLLGGLLPAMRRGGEPPRRLEQYHMSAPELGELRWRLHALLEFDPVQQHRLVEVAVHDLYERVALALTRPPDPEGLRLGDRRRVVQAAEAHVREHARTRITLADLCRVSRCSERTLRYAFHAQYGVSPASFVKRVRLQGLRRDLLRAEPGSATVIDLALRWGFWHQGHLSRDYKRLFGETPVDTLSFVATAGGGSRRTRDDAA